MQQFQVRTDLALEATESVRKQEAGNIRGVVMEEYDVLFVRDSSKWRFRCCGTIPETTVYKGEVTRMSDLPIEPEIGDVYKVSGKTVFFDGCWNEIASAE